MRLAADWGVRVIDFPGTSTSLRFGGQDDAAAQRSIYTSLVMITLSLLSIIYVKLQLL